MNRTLAYSHDGLLLTQGFESCRLVPYWDAVAGIWTDGWGNTHGVTPHGPAISQVKADADLLANLAGAVATVNRYVTVQLNQHEFDACVDFVFNCGSGNFAASTLLKYLNAGNFAAAADEFQRWDMSKGQHIAGLLRRRLAEAAEFRELP